MLNGGAIAWGCRKQKCTSGSTTEYVLAHLASNETVWLHSLMSNLGYSQRNPTIVYCDNQSAIRLVPNPIFPKQSKHIALKYHIIREQQAEGHIKITYICTNENDQLIDEFTKPLPETSFSDYEPLSGSSASSSSLA